MACTPSGIFPWAVNKMISDSGDIFFIVFMFFLFSGRKKVQIVLRFNLAKRLFIDIFLQSTNNDMDLYIIEFGG